MPSSFTGSCDIIEKISLLLPEGRNGCQDTFSKVTACTTLGPKAPLAPEHDMTQGALCGIVVGSTPCLYTKVHNAGSCWSRERHSAALLVSSHSASSRRRAR